MKKPPDPAQGSRPLEILGLIVSFMLLAAGAAVLDCSYTPRGVDVFTGRVLSQEHTRLKR